MVKKKYGMWMEIIYGTTNHTGVIYWWGGFGLFTMGILAECILHRKN